MGERSEEVGEQGQMFPVLRHIVGLCNEKTGLLEYLFTIRMLSALVAFAIQTPKFSRAPSLVASFAC